MPRLTTQRAAAGEHVRRRLPAVASSLLGSAAEHHPGGAAKGSLTLSIWRVERGVNEAGHEDIPGLVATADLKTPRFQGSPLQRFITAAFDGTPEPGCAATVVNASKLHEALRWMTRCSVRGRRPQGLWETIVELSPSPS